MNALAGFDIDQIKKASDEIKKKKPEFTVMLDLYEKIFIAQEKARKIVSLPEFNISQEKLSVQHEEKFPLVDISQFSIDQEVSESLFNELCDILTADENELSAAVVSIKLLSDEKKIDLNKLFTAFFKEDESLFDEAEVKYSIDKEILGFLIYNALQPSLVSFSEMISVNLDSDNDWEKGYCPVCGSMPELSLFEENGKRFLVCGFCGHKWGSKRIYCPFCENSNHETLQYYDIDSEEEYRVDVCEKCKKYIKTIDIKKTSRTVYPPLEIRSTPYIDVKLEEMGYKKGNE
ncbi:MAG TPA: formate dehydrogenase accessory protein FdhE [Spirochaetota bacterium]|nr:formate dehydrogenase accessory protein FdhE [Spirochaetota bacterium]